MIVKYSKLFIAPLMIVLCSPITANAVNTRNVENVDTTSIIVENDNRTIVRTEEVSFDTRIVEDSVLPEGVEIVIQEGERGVKTFYKSTDITRSTEGEKKEIAIISEEVTILPTEKVVRRGTNAEIIDGVSEKTLQLEKEKAEKIAEQARLKAEAEEEARLEAEKEAEEAARLKAEQEHKNSLSTQQNTQSLNIDNNYSNTSDGVLTSPYENREYARSVISAEEFQCADKLVNRESGWVTNATNPSSGAYGVPQSLPASKLASAGADWKTNGKTQFNWMISYVNSRYGNFCNALNFSYNNGWY